MKSHNYETRNELSILMTFFLALKGLAIGIFTKVHTPQLPQRIGNYSLSKKIKKQWIQDTNALGIYTNKLGQKAFAKMIRFNFKSVEYFKLKNEILIYKLTEKYSKKGQISLSYFRIPQFITHKETQHTQLLLLKFVDGKRGDTLSSKRKLEVYLECMNFLKEMTHRLSNAEKKQLLTRTGKDYYVLYPMLLFMALYNNPKSWRRLLKGVLIFIKNANLLLSETTLTLSHRDLHFKNFIVSKNQAYLIDFESAGLTIPLYDVVITLWHEWDDKLFCEKLIEYIQTQQKGNSHFERYFKLLIVLVCTHALTADNYDQKDIRQIEKFLDYGITYSHVNSKAKNNIFFTIRKMLFNTLYVLSKPFSRNVISVLCFHSISDSSDRYSVSRDTFLREIKQIAQHSTFIDMDEALSIPKNHKSCVVLTFDDGYQDILDVLPILKKYSIRPLVFIVSDPEHVDREELDNSQTLLSWKEINFLIENNVQIGCHTQTHKDLTKLAKSQLKREVEGAKKSLEKRLGINIDYFAYPKGQYNSQIQEVVKNAGFSAAFSVDPGCITTSSNRWALPRTIIDKTHAISEFPGVYFPSTFFVRRLTNHFQLWERFLRV